MNERVEELSGLASLYAVSDNPNMLYDVWKKRYTEKFAELIVRECINCCDDIDAIQKHYLKYGIDQELGASECIEVIKKHFGVEE